MKPKAYIAGPMRGYPQYNFPAFHEAEEHFTRLGYEVKSPARMDLEQGFNPTTEATQEFLDAAISRDVETLLQCDFVFRLPGWENSIGAKAEYHLALWKGLKIQEYNPSTGAYSRVSPKIEVSKTFAISQELPQKKEEEDILHEAYRLTTQDRNNQYGPPDQDFTRTAAMWTALIAHKLKDGERMEAREVALFMMCLKMSRLTWAKKRDSLADICGYSRCMWIIDNKNS